MRFTELCPWVVLTLILVVALLSVNIGGAAAADPYRGDSDGDGRCTEVDALTALQMAAGMVAALPHMDVDGDGKVSEVDALTILQWAAAGGQCQAGQVGAPQAGVPGVTPPAPGPVTGTAPGGRLIINEVLPIPAPGEAEWVELLNVEAGPVDAAGWVLSNEKGQTYTLPANLPEVPAGAFVLVYFDGQGSALDDLDFSDNLAVLHTPAGMRDVFDDRAGQVGLYRGTPLDRSTIVDFVAWGDDPGPAAQNAVDAGFWRSGQFVVETDPSPGGLFLMPQGSIGVGPASNEWEVYAPPETTPGSKNRAPAPSFRSPGSGTTIASQTPVFAWSNLADAVRYRLQVDDDPGFGSPLIDTDVTESHLRPTTPLPDGKYYFRVRGILSDGSESDVSPVGDVTIASADAPGIRGSTQLDPGGQPLARGTPAADSIGKSGMASLQMSVPSIPYIGECSIQMFLGGTNNTFLSFLTPAEFTDGSPIPVGSLIEFEVFRSRDEGVSYTEPVSLTRVRGAAPRYTVEGDSRGQPMQSQADLVATTPVDCIEPRVVYLAVRVVVDGAPSALETRMLSFRYAAAGPPASDPNPTRNCYPMLIRYETVEDARAGIDLGLCPGPTPTPTVTPTVTPTGTVTVTVTPEDSKILPVVPFLQHKDSKMLCLDGCDLSGPAAWDAPHMGRVNPHDDKYCTRASIAMIVHYFGGDVYQDHISYVAYGGGAPEGDLGHGIGLWPHRNNVMSWALSGASIEQHRTKPAYGDVTRWIDEGRPILVIRDNLDGSSHAMVISGYERGSVFNWIYLIDPWTADAAWVDWDTFPVLHSVSGFAAYVPPANARGHYSVDDGLHNDYDADGDGILDFDETHRFRTDPNNPDTDGDWVPDKVEIRGYVFDGAGAYRSGYNPDIDGDGRRNELDPDSDGGGMPDGCEDRNLDGIFGPGETNVMDPSDDDDPVNDDCMLAVSLSVGPCDDQDEADVTILAEDTTPRKDMPVTNVRLSLDGTEVHNSGTISADRYEHTLRLKIDPPDQQHELVLQAFNSGFFSSVPREKRMPISCGAVVTGPVSSSVLISIDNSGSMSSHDRIGAAKRSAQSALGALPADAEVAIQFFGVSGCDVRMVLDFTVDHAAASSVIDTAVARGSTPLAAAIEQAGVYMRQNARGASMDIILLSDGEETCRGKPEDAARGLNAFVVPGAKCPGLASMALQQLLAQQAQVGKPPIRLHVIGFDVSDHVEQQLKAVAAAGGGNYYSAGDEAQLTQVFTQAAQQISRPSIVKGDSDGDGRCTEVDALVALQMAAGAVPADPTRMDVTGDGQVTEIDALTVLQWAAAGGQCGP